jgi:lactonase
MSTNVLHASPEAVLSYTDGTRSFVPIPLAEQHLPTAIAEPYFKVADEAIALEGPAFDRDGNLFFVDVYSGRILRLSTSQALSVFYTDTTLSPAGVAIHKDGRIFVAGVGDFAAGKVVAIDPDGNHCQTIVPASAGFVPDDLVFDKEGGFYFTDFKGGATRPEGGVYYVSPDFETITAVLPNVCAANGVTLSPDGMVLWATEFCAGRLHRMDLASPTTIGHFGSTVPYHFIGRSPDSMRADANGNVYVAMYQQGRILAFNPYGMPIGQILLPGREDNQFLKSTSLAFVPGSRDVVIVSRDENGTGGSMIFRAQALAEGVLLFSHQ